MKKQKFPNRPFEFRVWHIPTKTLHYDIEFFDSLGVWRQWDDSKSDDENYKVVQFPLPIGDCVVMQFTGCYDPTGAKVWEGDIMRYDNEDVPKKEEYSSFYVVVFHSGCFCSIPVDNIKRDPETWDTFVFSEGVTDKVVGNRWEHLYLMKVKGMKPLYFMPEASATTGKSKSNLIEQQGQPA